MFQKGRWRREIRLRSLTACLLFVCTVLQASSFPAGPAEVCARDHGTARFSWRVSEEAKGKIVVIVDPRGRVVMNWISDCRHILSVRYADRVQSDCKHDANVVFNLSDVTAADEGGYTCRDFEETGPLIPACGQTLLLLDPGLLKEKCRYVRRNRTVTCGDVTLPQHSQVELVDDDGNEVKRSYGPWLSHTFPSMESGHFMVRVKGQGQGCVVPFRFFVDERQLPRPDLSQKDPAVEGQEVILNCVVLSDPTFFLENEVRYYRDWFKDSVQLEDEIGDALYLHHVTWQDRGVYTCRLHEHAVRGSVSVDSNPLTLTVLRPPKVSVRRHEHRSHIDAAIGTHMTLTCEVESAFPPVPSDGFSWSFSPSDSSPARPLSHTGDTLTLGPMTREDSGQYKCQARNDQVFHGRFLLKPGTDVINVTVVYLENMSLTTVMEVMEGEDLSLTCTVDSTPTAQLQWLVDGKLRRYVTVNVDHYVVVKATRRDGGNYTCRARNSMMTVQQSTAVSILYEKPADLSSGTRHPTSSNIPFQEEWIPTNGQSHHGSTYPYTHDATASPSNHSQ